MLSAIVAILLEWKKVFAQPRTADRAIRQALASVCVIGRRTIARAYLVQAQAQDWSADYKLFSRSPWPAQHLFHPILQQALAFCPGKFLPLGADDTRLKKTGKKIATAAWGVDPLSPPFRINLQFGLRFLHAAVLLPLHLQQQLSARALPVFFQEVAPLKKPGKRSSEDEQQTYRQAIKRHNLSTYAVAMMQQLRVSVDQLGGKDKLLAFALDGSYCNRTVLGAALDRTVLIARARKDAKLCWPLREGRRRYSRERFTPEEVLKDERRAWQQAEIFHGGKQRQIAYKEVNHLLWRRAGCDRLLRLLVVRPTAYRKTKKGRLLYRQAAYLLTTDLESAAGELMQIYFDRWQVEVAHRELKESFGVGQAQVRVAQAVARQPALQVATYSAMHLAALQAWGPQRADALGPLPKYQRDKTRASCQELIRRLRHEVVEACENLPFDLKITSQSILAAATT